RGGGDLKLVCEGETTARKLDREAELLERSVLQHPGRLRDAAGKGAAVGTRGEVRVEPERLDFRELTVDRRRGGRPDPVAIGGRKLPHNCSHFSSDGLAYEKLAISSTYRPKALAKCHQGVVHPCCTGKAGAPPGRADEGAAEAAEAAVRHD